MPRTPGIVDRLGLLALRVGAKLAALDGLEPRCPEKRDGEEKEKAGEEQAESTIDQAHGVTPPPVSGAAGVVVSVRHDRGGAVSHGRAAGVGGDLGGGRVDGRPVAGSSDRRLGHLGDRRHVASIRSRSRRGAAAARPPQGIVGAGRQHQGRRRLRHDEPDADRRLLKALVGQAVGDVRAKRRVRLAKLVGEAGRLRRLRR